MGLIQDVLGSSVGAKEERSPTTPPEGCPGLFGLILQSLMQLQSSYPVEPCCAEENGVQFSGEGQVSALEVNLNQPPSKAAMEGLKVSTDVLPSQTLKSAVLHRHGETSELLRPSLEYQHMMTRDALEPHCSMEGAGQLKLFSEANTFEKAIAVGVDVLNSNGASGALLDERKAVIGDLQQASAARLENDAWRHVGVVAASDVDQAAVGDMDTGFRDDSIVQHEGVNADGDVAARHQSPARMNNEDATPFASSDKVMLESASDDMVMDGAHESATYDSTDRQEGHVHERLYVTTHPHKLFHEEMSSMSSARAVNAQETLSLLADRVKVLVSNNRSEMEVSLKPQELGKVVVKVAMENGALSVRITVESQMVKDFIQTHAEELRTILADEGYNLADLDVNIGQGHQQPQQHDMGSGMWPESQIFRRSATSMTAIQRSLARVTSTYYDGVHQFDCFA